MRISVVGCGYLGAVHAACMAELGHEVTGIDVDEAKIEALSAGRAPFYEPGFDELLTRALGTGRLRFTTDPGCAGLAEAELHFIAVGTPQSETGAADLSYVDAAVQTLLAGASPGSVVAGKSTVPVGTAARLAERLAERDLALVWNPEFLREVSPSPTRFTRTASSTACPLIPGQRSWRAPGSTRHTLDFFPTASRRSSPTMRRRSW